MRSAPFARKLRCLQFCLHNAVLVLSNIQSHFCAFQLCVRIFFILLLSDVHKDLSLLRMKNWNQKYKSRTSSFISWIIRWDCILSPYSIYREIMRPVLFKFVINRKVITRKLNMLKEANVFLAISEQNIRRVQLKMYIFIILFTV